MQPSLALFSQPRAFGSFVGTKEQGKPRKATKSLPAREAGASGTALQRWTFATR